MKLTEYLQTRNGALAENRFSRWALLIQSIIILVLSFSLAIKRTAVVMVPPTLEERTEIASNNASQEAQIAWGLYITGLLGNVTPTSSEFLVGHISRYLSPRMYRPVIESIEAQIKEIREEQITLSFIPTIARYDDKKGSVMITGQLVIRAVRGQEKRETRTYEMRFITRNYVVLLDELNITEGPRGASQEQGG